MPSLERLDELFDEPLRLEELLDPDDALMPPLRSLELEELEPLFEALRPPERSCELLRPELVLPDAPRPSLRDEVLLSVLLEFEAL